MPDWHIIGKPLLASLAVETELPLWQYQPMNRIKELRKANGLTQERLAELMGVDTSMAQRLESGKRKLTLEYILLLAQIFRITPGEVISDPEEPTAASELVDLLSNMDEEAQKTLLRVAKGLSSSVQDSTPPKTPGRAA